MKILGSCLLALGFLGAALLASQDPEQVRWPLFLAALVPGGIGLALLKRAEKASASDPAALTAARDVLTGSLDRIADTLAQLNEQALPAHEARFEIDRLFREDLAAFAEARGSVAQIAGLKAYGEVMSAFAAGERYINRVWSASADGYEDEVRAYLARAALQMAEARDRLRSVLDKA